ncbi:hypothetical protein CTRI78_v012098 [Colletotrichum trifolii]|uniref:Importin 13 n=1 Tax=Colletotrichum trifolii TaxID=5466 RepID=A0A4R8PVK6_COLTR|nr:hypothetical protein CTRI78_v012098 [Colletotrichum trifolii]
MDDEIPSTTQQTEALILALYEPAPPETIARIQETLHRLQRAPSAWCIARDLLSYADDKVKFFGALTLIVKLNTERHFQSLLTLNASSSLSVDDISELLQNLVGWLIESLTNGSSAMVIRKLCSALVTFFLYFPKQWELCIRHLCCSLCEGVPASQESVLSPVNFSGFLGDADPRKLHAAVWFCGTLVDEAAKVEMNSATHSGLYEILMLNVSDAMALMTSAFGCNESSPTFRNVDLRRDVIICLQATFMTLRDTDSGAQETIDHAVSHLGPFLAQSIIRNVGGNASRSELDRLSEPLKKMVSHHLNARAWLEQALFDPSFPSQQVSREAKLIFLKKVIK